MVFAVMNQLATADTGNFLSSMLLLFINVQFEAVCER
jgi:hypothetical protein